MNGPEETRDLAGKQGTTSLEGRLAAALSTTASAVRAETLRPLSPARRPARRWALAAAPAAAAAAVVLIVGVAVGIGRMSAAPHPAGGPAQPRTPGRTTSMGGYPLRVVFDPSQRTIYALTGRQLPAADLTVIGTAACNAAAASACAQVRHVAVPGPRIQDITVDPRNHTLYVLSGSGQRDTVAVIDAAACDATDTAGCGGSRAAVHVPPGATGLAVNPRDGSIYVTYNRVGQLSVINGQACNATRTAGCGAATQASPVLLGTWPQLAADPATDTLYYVSPRGLSVIDGRACSGTDVLGCGKALATVPLPFGVSQVVADQADGSLYVTESGTGAVAVIDLARCNAHDTSGCAVSAAARGGPTPVYEAADPSVGTLYVTGGDGSVYMVDTSTCRADTVRGCSHAPSSFPADGASAGMVLDPAAHTLYVAGGAGMTVVNTDTCNATRTSGCPRTAPAGTGALPGAQRHNPTYWCDSSLTAYDAGLPAGPFERKAVRVASGSTDGLRWSVWAKQGIIDPYAIEQGGMVLNGRWYGLCQHPLSAGPGYSFAMIDTGSHGIAYGFIQHPLPVRITLSAGGKRWSPSSVLLTGTTFYISLLPQAACSYHAMTLSAVATRGPAWSGHINEAVNACTPGRLVTLSEEGGVWGPGSGN